MVGVGKTYISQIENGVRTPGQPLILRMAEALGVESAAICLAPPVPHVSAAEVMQRRLNEIYGQLSPANQAALLSSAETMLVGEGKA